MGIVTAYVREQKRYLKSELRTLFSFDEPGVEQFIKKLKTFGVLKSVKYGNEQLDMSDLVEEDIEIVDETAGNRECLYVFTYVGIITVGNRVLKIYPKYIMHDNEPLGEMKQVVRVLKKYSNSERQIVNLYNGNGENKSFNTLAVILYLLNDYHEYGIYNNSEDILEINGEGDIQWGRTIDEGLALIEDNTPYYMDLYTRKNVDDEYDYFKRLHECVLTECSKQLRLSQLEEIFQMVTVELSEESIKDFGDKEYILDRILAELNVQFNTRKQILLKTLYAYISQDKKMLEDDAGISMYGTTAFNMVWEHACAEVFDNKLTLVLDDEVLPKPLGEKFKKFEGKFLKEIIQHPVWEREGVKEEAVETLKPDLISFVDSDGGVLFVIFDAKYYNLTLEKGKLRGNPGVGDVDKQFLYQLAYKDFVSTHGFIGVKNCFLMPTEKDQIEVAGTVDMPMLSALELEKIQVRKIPAKMLFDYYLSPSKKIDFGELQL